MASVPGFTTAAGRALFAAGAAWGTREPWLQMRLNHVLRIDVPWAPHWKYVQVLGGGGNCDPGLYICADASELDREDHDMETQGKGVLRSHGLYMFIDKAAEGGYDFHDLDYIRDNGFAEVEPHEDLSKRILPHFTHAKFAPPWDIQELRRWHPSVSEMAFLQATCRAVVAVLQSGQLASPPNHHHGDHRQFYRMDTTVDIPDAIVPPGYEAKDNSPHSVRVRFPAFPADERASQLFLMFNAVARGNHPGVENVGASGGSGASGRSGSHGNNPAGGPRDDETFEMFIARMHRMQFQTDDTLSGDDATKRAIREGMALKSLGNDYYKKSDWGKALECYDKVGRLYSCCIQLTHSA
jgi:hypothetical protein